MAEPGISETNSEIDKKSDMEFEPERVKALYTKKVKEYLSDLTVDVDTLWNRTTIDKLIEDVNNGKECIKMHLTRTCDQYNVMKKYSTGQAANGKYVLLLKCSKQQQVVPCEESFDMVMKAHRIAGHVNKKKVYETLCLSYSLPKWCVDIMEQVCNVCQKNKCKYSKYSRKYNEKAYANVWSLPQPDGHFKYVLVYEEMFTKYVHMRPLHEKFEDQLAMELLQIFMNFGPPMYLCTSNKISFQLALANINTICRLPCAVLMDKSNKHLEVIVNKIVQWMDDNETGHWALGCQIVQWEHNNNSVYNRLSPYEMVFGHKPFTKSVTEEVYEAFDEFTAGAQDDAKKKLCNQCSTTLTDIYICERCRQEVHKICCQFNISGKFLCFSCRDKEDLLDKLRSTAQKVKALIINGK